MSFDKLKTMKNTELLRLTGVNNNIFNKMIDILKEAEFKKVKKIINYHWKIVYYNDFRILKRVLNLFSYC